MCIIAFAFCVGGEPKVSSFYEQRKQKDETILTIATEHLSIAEKYFLRKDIVADSVTISGSSEIMPKSGCVDVIFAIVESDRA
jgi:ATP phosphoribosyltransferase